ncbi:DNA-binding protein [Adhaeribacter aerolatus]|uniref:DNA-binding protein n=1 Tax=Adhaeribacter aerolatus TaxID=670289 RepID=A0A512AZM4_9BACT|nr:NAD(P)-binding domain-containing protein [Adhaeribacter aerolatus]GEO05168.1 DNA-binding protein [Adhaeribacter aerolatus]
MKIGILGTGMVGTTIGSKLIKLNHEVKLGSRAADNPKAIEWVKQAGANASQGTFTDAAAFGEIIFNCTKGDASLAALQQAGAANLAGKILLDVANPLDFSRGMPPTLIPEFANTTSLGEEIQKAFPETKVVKTLNTVNCNLMVDASLVAGEHDLFICGNDKAAKERVIQMLQQDFNWTSIIDLGDITNARATEMILPLWVRLYGYLQTPNFNLKVVS